MSSIDGNDREVAESSKSPDALQCEDKSRLRVNEQRANRRKQYIIDGTFSCDMCLFKGGSNFELLRHNKTHLTDKLNCASCQYKTNSKDACGKCILIAGISNRLKENKRHDGVKAYTCDECDKSFVTAAALILHNHQHSGVKLHVCELCDFATARASTFKAHRIRIHIGTKPLGCELCDFRCVTKSDLNKHVKRKHK